MKKTQFNHHRGCEAFSLSELMIAISIYVAVVGAIMVGFTIMQRSLYLGQDYATARLTLSDYFNMDLRRSTQFEPTIITNVTHGGWKCDDWTLPAVIVVPDYYAADGTTPNAPVRRTLTSAEWEQRKEDAIARGRPIPPTWEIVYGDTTKTRMVVYQQQGNNVVRQEGYGTFSRPTTNSVSWSWTGTAPNVVAVAGGVVQITGIYRPTADLSPEDLTEAAPDSAIVGFRGNYTIIYLRSNYSHANPEPGTILNNNILMRYQFYGY